MSIWGNVHRITADGGASALSLGAGHLLPVADDELDELAAQCLELGAAVSLAFNGMGAAHRCGYRLCHRLRLCAKASRPSSTLTRGR